MWEDEICRKNGTAPPVPVDEEPTNPGTPTTPTLPDGTNPDGSYFMRKVVRLWILLMVLA